MLKNEEIEEIVDNDVNNKEISEEVVSIPKEENEEVVEKEETNSEKSKETTEKSEKVTSENKVDEATVIEKIKDFISKIIAMQEEASKENVEENGIEEDKEKAKKETTKKKYNKPEYMLEYYDLPYRYNETVVKILAQTPKRLFVYWDISDNDRNKYVETFGGNFFEKTYPVLLLFNEDKKYVKEVAINDFANSWYIDIDDPKTKYTIQLGRKFRNSPEIVNIAKFQENNIILQTDYLPFANSNVLEVPNDHVLLEDLPRLITFRNVKTNEETTRYIGDFKDAFGNNYNVKEFYTTEYKDELSEGMFDMANPSSNLSSSTFK